VDWYYALGGQRFGPFSQGAFDQLLAQGRITGVTLVWREGLDDWVQYQLLSSPDIDQGGQTSQYAAQCSQCLRSDVHDNMIQYQGHWICSECKDTFFQRVREGNFSPTDPAGTRQYDFAGYWIRFGAAILDGLILLCVNIALALPIIYQRPLGRTSGYSQGIVNLLMFVIMITYMTWFIGKYGATPGKMACGLKVIVSTGRKVSYGRSFGRAWAWILSIAIPYFSLAITVGVVVGLTVASHNGIDPPRVEEVLLPAFLIGILVGLLMSFPFYMAGPTKQKCALHDFICNTRVVRER